MSALETLMTALANEADVLGDVGLQRGLEIGCAVVCGVLLGADRRAHGSAVGMRTCTLVCLGAVLYTHVGQGLVAAAGGADPTRIPAQVVTGIGFLGAGAIIHQGRTVTGLTSAAVIWVMGAIGVMIGSGYPVTATVAVLAVLVLLRVLGRVEAWLIPAPSSADE